MKDMKKYRSATRFFENNKHFLSLYPQVANMAVEEMMTVDSTPKKEKQSKIIREVLRRRSIPGLVRDLWGMWRNLY
jgi:electron transfer flavoprotein-quinone oxidoreductase